MLLDNKIEDRSPTPESRDNCTNNSSHPSPPPSPSPSPEFIASNGDRYRTNTLQLMATAPSHLRKSSDEKLLEDFFGMEQLTKLDMFKSQISIPRSTAKEDKLKTSGSGGLIQGISMPNISSSPSGVSLVSVNKPVKPVILRPLKPRYDDANRKSYDVASEMEKLRARLQETAIQELAEFDRKYSPKLYHSSGASVTSGGSNSHSREGSMDSTTPKELSEPPPTIAVSHVRQYSLPVDQELPQQLQQNRSNGNNLSPLTINWWNPTLSKSSDHIASNVPPHGHIRQISGSSVMSEDSDTFSPPLTPSLQQVHNEFSLSNTATKTQSGSDVRKYVQQYQSGKGSELMRISSTGHVPSSTYNRQSIKGSNSSSVGSNSSTSSRPPSGKMNDSSVGLSSSRPASGKMNEAMMRSSSGNKLHYSTTVLKRGKANNYWGSQELGNFPAVQQRGISTNFKGRSLSNGTPSIIYDRLDPHRRGSLEIEPETKTIPPRGVNRYPSHSNPREGKIPASPRMTRKPDVSDAHHINPQYTKLAPRMPNGKNTATVHPEDITPYMTSSHVRAQMQNLNFTYTPFSEQSQQRAGSLSTGSEYYRYSKPRANTVSSGSPSQRLNQKRVHQLKSNEQTWI